jgi:mannose-6-phosphate isomerase class I
MNINKEGRNSGQPLLPVHTTGNNIYPVHALTNGMIHEGYAGLANWMATQQLVLIDGYAGIIWPAVYNALKEEFRKLNINVQWFFTEELYKPSEIIDELVAPFVGNVGDVWGTKTTLSLTDFFDAEKLAGIKPDPAYVLNIIIGTGAALTSRQGTVVYLEIAKNELQYRMRAGTVTNVGNTTTTAHAEMYKRFYFVDWVVLNEYKRTLMNRIRIFADAQWFDTLTWITSEDLGNAMEQISHGVFRVRPWFEPGAWGGQWIKEHIEGLNKEEVNYAWSFELIVPENGILFGAGGNALELPFEWLMFYQYKAILGKHADIFKYEFPIRFDFLDTFDGGNLSIQCHPSLNYIREHFGENITQDETYYILDCKEDATVYLGFQEGIDPATFRKELENSQQNNQPLNIVQFVQQHKATRHDLFLIPNGTVHSAGANNMVLEISATPYIFTFKMYDWLRLGLDGKPRAINIAHAFNNLDFSRQGAAVSRQLISVPKVIDKSADWQVVHMPTHAEHFYDVHRLEFDTEIVVQTNDCCLVLMLVEGSSVAVITENGERTVYQYAETFVIPAATKMCLLSNMGEGKAKVIKAFLKEDHHIYHATNK